jgi:hypothetical protein
MNRLPIYSAATITMTVISHRRGRRERTRELRTRLPPRRYHRAPETGASRGGFKEALDHCRACCDHCGRGGRRGCALFCLPGPGRHRRRRGPKHSSVLQRASGHAEDGTKLRLQGPRGAGPTAGLGSQRRRGRLAELQQDSHYRAIFGSRVDQFRECRQTQGAVHLRHETICGLSPA